MKNEGHPAAPSSELSMRPTQKGIAAINASHINDGSTTTRHKGEWQSRSF